MFLDLKYKKFDSPRRFGVEIEMSAISKVKVNSALKLLSNRNSFTTKYQLTNQNSSWHIKDDSTCGGPLGNFGDKGVEIASYVAKGNKDIAHIANVANGLYKAGCRVNDNCGLHIHAEAKDLTTSQVGVLVAYWIKIQPIIAMSLPFCRVVGNPYCEQLFKKDLDLSLKWKADDIWEIFKPKNLNYHENEDRRVSLNLVNYTRAIQFDSSYRKTLELRWPEGTLKGQDIRCWVRLFLNFIDNCKDRPMPLNLQPSSLSDVLTCFSLNHNKKSFFIISKELHDSKTWFLERIIKNCDKPNVQWSVKLADEHGHPVISLPAKTVANAKKTLNSMWSPLRKYK